MMTGRQVLLLGCAIFFSIGLVTGYAQAQEPQLELAPNTNDSLAQGVTPETSLSDDDVMLPAEPIPSEPESGDYFLYNLLEPSQTLSDENIVYAI